MANFLKHPDNIKRLAYLISEKVSTKEIAQEFSVSTRTVERWQKHSSVVEEVDKLIRSKTQIIDDAWQREHEKYKQQVQEFMDRSIKDISVLRDLNNICLGHVAKKLETISHEDIPAKLIPNYLKSCMEVIKALDEIECTKLTVGELMKKLDEVDNGN